MSNYNETILEVDFRKLEHNFKYLTSKLSNNCKIIAVIKAFAYGHGDIEVARKLEKLGVYAFWVADFEEGVTLRNSGIKTKIIIANPGLKSYTKIIENNLEIVIHNMELLKLYCNNTTEINVHLKFNTGMNRYGFDEIDINYLCDQLNSNKHLKVKSLCSHLSTTESTSRKEITEQQLLLFETVCEKIESRLKKRIDKHILNSTGFFNFPEKQFNFVRLGISLFGSFNNSNLKQISKFKTVISNNRDVKKGDAVGYSSTFITNKDMNISVVPVGYADGLNRRLGNGIGSVMVNGVMCSIIGNICMDSFTVDTSEINCKIGDEVEIFGHKNSILNLSEKIGTIPYEIYSTLNRRIKRVYIDTAE